MATVFTPYTDFVVVLAGLGLAAAALFTLTGLVRAAPSAVAVAVAVLLTALVFPTLWRGASAMDGVRTSLKFPDPRARYEKCFLDRGRGWQLGFVYWVQARTQPGDSFALDSRVADRACFQLNMLSQRLVRRDDEPVWTVRIRGFSRELRERIRQERALPPDQRRVRVFGPGLALIGER